MDWIVSIFLALFIGSIGGIAFVIHKIMEEEKERREKLAFIKAFSAKHNVRRRSCPNCGCLPCHCCP
jgi:hypothetical protein